MLPTRVLGSPPWIAPDAPSVKKTRSRRAARENDCDAWRRSDAQSLDAHAAVDLSNFTTPFLRANRVNRAPCRYSSRMNLRAARRTMMFPEK